MTPDELAKSAADALNRGATNVQIVLPRRVSGGRRMRVFGGKGQASLFGEVACENSEGHAVVWVDAMELLAYLAAAGLVNFRGPDGEVLS